VSAKLRNLLTIVGPGILVAATGVGAGDLATASFTGNALGTAVLWAVVLGAFLKFVLNEGLARWQLATGDTLLEGCVERFGRPVLWLFLCYLIFWSFLVAAALMSAVGATCHAMLPLWGEENLFGNQLGELFGNPLRLENQDADKIFYGIVHSLVAVVLVRVGGYRLFARIMGVCIGVMFVVVLLTAVVLRPPVGEVLTGLLWPTIPPRGVAWTVALMGGVGGTVTVLCYGYWIREEGRGGAEQLKTCRIDLMTAYAITAVFGLAMVVIGSRIGPIEGGGATLIVEIARQLETTLGAIGPIGKWAFLIGAWGAIFSSLLGVWQSVPYLFADCCSLARRHGDNKEPCRIDPQSLPYRAYLLGIALVPIVGLIAVDFKTIQKKYAIVGAMFIPLLALVLLVLNGRARWVGARLKNSLWTTLILIGTLLFFLVVGVLQIHNKWFAEESAAEQTSAERE